MSNASVVDFANQLNGNEIAFVKRLYRASGRHIPLKTVTENKNLQRAGIYLQENGYINLVFIGEVRSVVFTSKGDELCKLLNNLGHLS